MHIVSTVFVEPCVSRASFLTSSLMLLLVVLRYSTGIIPTIDMFNLPIFLFITPMFLFSGTFFPVSGIPAWAGIFSLVFPLYHLVELTRFLCIGAMESRPVLNLAYLLLFTMVFVYLALGTMKRKLIK